MLPNIYRRFVLQQPYVVLALLLIILAFFALQARHFSLDASADALLLEDDKDLQIYRKASGRYSSGGGLLLVTYEPDSELFSDPSLTTLGELRDELSEVESVKSVFSLLEVPLLVSSGVELTQLASEVPTLASHPDTDLLKVRAEIMESPVFSELILSKDGSTTALLVRLKSDPELYKLSTQRSQLRLLEQRGELTDEQHTELAVIEERYDLARAVIGGQRHRDIESIRSIMASYGTQAELHLGGVPMVSDDMITYIKKDLVTFGLGVLLFIVLILALIFRRIRWVALPIASCFFSGLFMLGLLGFLGWKVTVISSNFISLMLILTMSMNMHLIVRYRQLRNDQPQGAHVDNVLLTTRRMFWPCLYTALTTIIGFSSLVFSGIKPVIDFGWMMSIGLLVTFLTSFLLFPSLLVALGPLVNDDGAEKPVAATAALAKFTQRHGYLVLGLAVLLALLSVIGISRLQVENSFIDYFRENTEIYQGMKLIDERLGGTTPLQVLLDMSEVGVDDEGDECGDLDSLSEEERELCEELALFEEDGESEESWFNYERVERIKQVHDYLDSLPAVGKVLSLASVLRVGERLKEDTPFTPFELDVLYNAIPEDLRSQLIDPYVSIDDNEARITLRILDSMPDLRRKELLDKIRGDLQTELDIPEEKAVVTGILVLYNNMLQSLFQSQIKTVGAVLLGIAIMFMVLFRSLPLAVIGILPNALAAALVMGVMGWLRIPLDMMTITIATITIGIAVDNSIHYIYRFKEEYPKHKDYHLTMDVCHANIGRAVLYTSITIIFGFSILVFSNFIPTILFGLLTALAMFAALLAVLTLLPKLIVLWKPF